MKVFKSITAYILLLLFFTTVVGKDFHFLFITHHCETSCTTEQHREGVPHITNDNACSICNFIFSSPDSKTQHHLFEQDAVSGIAYTYPVILSLTPLTCQLPDSRGSPFFA